MTKPRRRSVAMTFLATLLCAWTAHVGEPCAKGAYLFFDLGNVLIDTSDWDHLRYMSGAQDYLHELQAAGYRLGMIINIPESWGKTNDEKMVALKSFVAQTWVEPKPYEWEDFATILLPPTNAQRKPAPFLFQEALKVAAECPALYQGEDEKEIAAAAQLGMKTFNVGKQSQKSFYLPVDQIPAYTGAAAPAPARQQQP